jgi:D-serine deaminase-like pyridoxal phosphate-dependent protein
MHLSRRSFLATAALGAGLATQQEISMGETYSGSALAHPPLTKSKVPTPALLLDLDRFEFNLKTIADECQRQGCRTRPHVKSHKCPEIARRQVDSGSIGVSAATVPEAEAMVAGGIRSVLLTSPILDPDKITRMLNLAKSGAEILLAVGHPREMQLLVEAVDSARVVVNVLLDLDVGDGRFGILPGKEALELALSAARCKHLRVRGVQAYSGMSSHVLGFEAREKSSRAAMNKAVTMRADLEKAGLDAPIVSGGSTGTYNIDSTIKGVSELQCGSYVFMDVQYMNIGGKSGSAVYADFQPSLSVLATVVSATHPDRVTIDAGIKAFSTDTADTPQPGDGSKLHYRRFGDEFGLLTADAGTRLPKIGDRLEFYVPHCDPTVNLYDRIYATRGENVEAIWPIVARREFIPASS